MITAKIQQLEQEQTALPYGPNWPPVLQKRNEIAFYREHAESIKRALDDGSPEKYLTENPSLLNPKILQLEQELAVLRINYGENWPAVREKVNEIATLKAQIGPIVGSLEQSTDTAMTGAENDDAEAQAEYALGMKFMKGDSAEAAEQGYQLAQAKLGNYYREGGAGIPSIIPDGMRAVSVRVDSVIGIDYVLPGMRVDAILTFVQPEGSKKGVSRIVLENIQVLAYDQKVEQNPNGQPQNVSIVTLLVTPEQAQELKTARPGRVQLVAHFGGDGKAITPSRDQLFSPQKRTGLPSPRPDGMRAISVRVESVIGDLGRFLVGARVDVIRTSMSPESTKGSVSRVILEDVQVLSAGPAMEGNSEGQPQRVGIVTLLVTPEQAKELVIAESDRIMLVLRNPLDTGGVTESRSGLFNTQSGNSLPSVIPDGMRAIAVRVDNTAGADNIKPGTRVDVIRTLIPPDGRQDGVSRIILENIQVLAFGQVEEQNSDGQPQKVTVVTLLVTPEQGQRLALGGSDGIQLAVRK